MLLVGVLPPEALVLAFWSTWASLEVCWVAADDVWAAGVVVEEVNWLA